MIYSETDPEDVDTTCEDHIYDEWRYMNMKWEIAPKDMVQKKNIDYRNVEDPLDMIKEQQRVKMRRYEYV